jgi:PPOX class probable FMN-dependent enzyme
MAPSPEATLRAELGQPADRTVGKVRDHLHPCLQEFIRHSPFAVLATSDGAGHCDASPRGGQPGFVRGVDERHLLLPDVAGNRLFQSYSNVLENPRVGLVFFLPGVDETARVNGRAERLSGDEIARRGVELEVDFRDDNTRLLQGLWIEVEEAYGHCPRALLFSRLWDGERIAAHRAERPIAKKPRGV